MIGFFEFPVCLGTLSLPKERILTVSFHSIVVLKLWNASHAVLGLVIVKPSTLLTQPIPQSGYDPLNKPVPRFSRLGKRENGAGL